MRLPKRTIVMSVSSFLLALSACGMVGPAAEGYFDRTLSVMGPVELDISTGSGSIDIRTGDSSVVKVHGRIQARDDWSNRGEEKIRYLEANPPIQQNGNNIRIGRIDNSAYRNNVSISYEIVVPAESEVRSETGSGRVRIEGIRGRVNAGTGSGSIDVSNIDNEVVAHTGSGSVDLDGIAGRVEASTGSGSIRAEHISGPIKAHTGSGSVMLQQTPPERNGARDVEADTGSGRIEVTGVDGSFRAQTGSGSITASGVPSGDWEVTASSGNVTLHLGANAAFDLHAHAGSGQITVDHPVTVSGLNSKHDIRGKVRDGGSLVEVRTSSGNIVIR